MKTDPKADPKAAAEIKVYQELMELMQEGYLPVGLDEVKKPSFTLKRNKAVSDNVKLFAVTKRSLPASLLVVPVTVLALLVLNNSFFERFKQHAAKAGSHGVHVLLEKMMTAADGSSTRFHLVGHSLGCHVVTSAAIGPEIELPKKLPKKLHSVTFLQGAVFCVKYEKKGPYYHLSNVPKPVAGPVIATTSKKDGALRAMELAEWLLLRLRLSFTDADTDTLGRHGFRKLALGADGKSQLETRTLQNDKTAKLDFKAGTFYTLNADAVIKDASSNSHDVREDISSKPQISSEGADEVSPDMQTLGSAGGAHGDLFDEELQARVWEAIDTVVQTD